MPGYNITIARDITDELVSLVADAVKDVSYLGRAEIDTVQALMNFVYADITQRVLFVLMHGNRPVGLLAGVCGNQHPIFEGITICTEFFWYVRPEHRTKDSIKLIEAYETWAKKIGARFITMAHFDDETGQRLSLVYKRLGYKPIEHSYVKELA